MLKRMIIAIVAIVMVNSAIDFAMADDQLWWHEEFGNLSQIGYDDTQKGNDNTEKDSIVSYEIGYDEDEVINYDEPVSTENNWWWF